MRTRQGWWLAGLVAVAGAVGPRAALAGEGDPTDVGLGDRLKELTRPEPVAPEDGVLVAVRVGQARFLRELARVEVTLQVHNTTNRELEWAREFPMEPAAEVIGCSLMRTGQPELIARTLTFEDGRRIYDETVRPPTPPPTGRDPLRVERQQDDRLAVTVFPVAPGESLRVRLVFAVPLEGEARRRRFLEPIWLDESTRPSPRGPVALGREVGTLTSLLVEPGGLAYAGVESATVAEGARGSLLAFRPEHSGFSGAQAKLVFHAPDGALPALTVPGGGLGTVVAFWRFDPAQFLAEQGLEARAGSTITLSAGGGLAQRLVPASVQAHGPAVTVCARVFPQAPRIPYHVTVATPDGERRVRLEQAFERSGAERELVDAVTAFYRSRLARHVLAWGRGRSADEQREAVAYAVDLGVIVPGTCALAIPTDEQERLSRASRRQYRRDGAEVGAADGEADWIGPPAGAFR
jgi:hypothetical protein